MSRSMKDEVKESAWLWAPIAFVAAVVLALLKVVVDR